MTHRAVRLFPFLAGRYRDAFACTRSLSPRRSNARSTIFRRAAREIPHARTAASSRRRLLRSFGAQCSPRSYLRPLRDTIGHPASHISPEAFLTLLQIPESKDRDQASFRTHERSASLPRYLFLCVPVEIPSLVKN